MYDVFSVVATIALFAVAVVYVRACESLTRSRTP